MRATSILLISLSLSQSLSVMAVDLDRCSVAKKLLKGGIPRSDLGIWTCIARYESEYKTHAVGGYTYGLFQIMGGGHWCSDHISDRVPDCNLRCTDLLDNDLTDDIRCALKIKNIQGYNAWSVWRNKCQHQDLSKYTEGCNF